MVGHKQKRLAENGFTPTSSSSSDSSGHSPLWITLMQRYAWGHMSATEVQQIALAAVQSGADKVDLNQLASLGAHGNSPQNAQRDLTRLVFPDVLTPNTVTVQVPLMAADGVKLRDYDMMLPHDWVAAVAAKGLLGKLMGTESSTLFWEQQDFRNNPQLRQCASFLRSIDFKEDVVIPMLLHGDGAPHTETDSLVVVSMRSILATLSVQMSQLLLLAMPKACMVDGSMQNVWKTLVWSFTALAEGVHPSKDADGRQYANMENRTAEQEQRHLLAGQPLGGTVRVRGVLMVLSGDIEWFCQQFNFPYAMSNSPCAFCKCDNIQKNSKIPFTDFSVTAKWKDTLLSPGELQDKFGKHPLMKIPGVSALNIKLDYSSLK